MQRSRVIALDRLRALAVLLMVQGHAFYELLAPSVKAAPWYRLHERVHGLTAPIFLFASGLAFGVTTLSRWDAHTQPGAAFAKRWRRYGILLVLAYMLQLPGFSLVRPLASGGLLAPAVLRVGPLHLLAFVLGLCQLLVLACRTRRRFGVTVGALTLGVLLAGPIVTQADATAQLPLPVAVWIDARHGSLFPIFPWAVFTLLGVLAGHVVVPARSATLRAPAQLATVSVGLAVALVLLAPRLWYGGFGPSSWAAWSTSPYYVLERVGYVLALFGAFCAFEVFTDARPLSEHDAVALLSRRSLVAYVAHLLLLYGTPFSPNVAVRVGATLGLLDAATATTLLLALTLLIAWAWDRLDRPPHAHTMQRVQLSLSSALLYCLVGRDAVALLLRAAF